MGYSIARPNASGFDPEIGSSNLPTLTKLSWVAVLVTQSIYENTLFLGFSLSSRVP